MARPRKNQDTPRPLPETLQIAGLSEYYFDQLTIEAWLKGRSFRAEAQALLSDMLHERHSNRINMLTDLARKRRITVDELIDQILIGKAEPLSPEQYAEAMENQTGSLESS